MIGFRFLKCGWLLWGMFWCFQFAVAKDHQYVFEQFTFEDGLPKNSIDYIVEGKDGFLYVCTPNGLGVFNGFTFKNYNTDNTPGFSNVITFAHPIDTHFTLVGTMDKGLFIFDRILERISPLETTSSHNGYLNNIQALYSENDSSLWLGGSDGVVLQLDLTSIKKNDLGTYESLSSAFPLPNGAYINALAEYKGYIVCGTNDAILYGIKLDEKQYPFVQLKDFSDVFENIISLFDNGGTLVMGTNNGAYFLESLKGESEQNLFGLLKGEVVQCITSYDKDLWLGTRERGLYKAKSQNGQWELNKFEYDPLKKEGLNSNAILSLHIDKNDNLWVGTWYGGLNKVNLVQPFFQYAYNSTDENDLLKNTLWCIEVFKEGKYFLGTYSNGLNLYDDSSKTYEKLPVLAGVETISSLRYDKKSNDLIVGTWGEGLKVINTETWKSQTLKYVNVHEDFRKDRIYALEDDNRGNVWIGGVQSGLHKINLGSKEIEAVELFENKRVDIRSIFLDADFRKLWVGTFRSGIYVINLDLEGNPINAEKVGLGGLDVESYGVFSINKLEGEIVFATGNGVYKWNGPNEVDKYIPGLEGVKCIQILQDQNGFVWVPSYNGLYKYNPKNGKLLSFFPERECKMLIFSEGDGAIFATTNNGLLIFNPNGHVFENHQPKIAFADLRIFDEKIIPGIEIHGEVILDKAINYIDKLVLPHFANVFSINVSAIELSGSKQISTYYQLEGVDKGWNERKGNEQRIIYTNLPAGDYVLTVKFESTIDEWEPVIRQLKIVKKMPWWFSPWAYFMYFLIVVIIVFVIVKDVRSRVKIKNELKLEKYKFEQNQALNVQKLAFFTNISHDLKTPLSLILNPVEKLLAEKSGEKEDVVALRMIQRNALHLLRMINQILDFRRVEGDTYQLNLHKIDLRLFLDNIIPQFSEAANKKHIELEKDLPNKPVWMVGDPDKLESIFFNLLSNSIKFTRKYGEIHVRLSDGNQGEYPILLEVEDSGIGIGKEELPHVFDRFYKNRLKNNEEGTGIGLAIVRKYTELHEGKIKIASQLNKGTVFTIGLPRFVGKTEPEELPVFTSFKEDSLANAIENAQIETTAKAKPEHTILIIEDNEDMRMHLNDLFEDKYNIILAEDGEYGLNMAKRKSPDLIISDIMMPGISGYEVCDFIKSTVATSHIPVILLTAKGSQASRIEGLHKGADAFIEKPFSTTLLKTNVENLIEHRQKLKRKYSIVDISQSGEVPSIDEAFMKKFMEQVEANIHDPYFSVQQIAEKLNLTHDQLYRKIKSLTGMTVNKYIRSIRLKKAANLLKRGDYQVAEIVGMVGFNSPSYFTKCFKEAYGELPSEYFEKYD